MRKFYRAPRTIWHSSASRRGGTSRRSAAAKAVIAATSTAAEEETPEPKMQFNSTYSLSLDLQVFVDQYTMPH